MADVQCVSTPTSRVAILAVESKLWIHARSGLDDESVLSTLQENRSMTIDHLGVVSAGLMGCEIALVFALAGKDVVLKDVDDERLRMRSMGWARCWTRVCSAVYMLT